MVVLYVYIFLQWYCMRLFSYCDLVCVYQPTVILYVFIFLQWSCMCLFSYRDLVCVYFPTVIFYVFIFLLWYCMGLFPYCDVHCKVYVELWIQPYQVSVSSKTFILLVFVIQNLPYMLPSKFQFIWLSSFKGEYFL
jgi:hypothetical protein